MRLIKQEEKPLLGRTEAVLEIEFEKAVPSMIETKKQAAGLLKTKENLIDIRKIDSKFGERRALVTAHAYTDEKSMKEFRTIPKAEKKSAEKKAEGAPAEAGAKKPEEEVE